VLGISPFLVGLILSANRFTRIVANAPAGALVDRLGTRRLLIIGLFIEGIATLGYVAALRFSPASAWFLGARVVWGLGSALVFATVYTIASDVSESGSRGTNMGIVRGGMTFGFPAGLVAGGIVSELASVPVAFGLAAGLALMASVLAYATVPETHVSVQRTRIKPWENRYETISANGWTREFWRIFRVFRCLVRYVGVVSRRAWDRYCGA
jgi:DHA1 family multidrug resistance protein-like MFS transporter